MNLTAKQLAFLGKSENTITSYKSDWRHFERWAIDNDRLALPATPETVRDFIISQLEEVSRPTIGRRKCAIGYYHRELGYPDPTTSHVVLEVMRGIARRFGTEPHPKSPLTADLVLRLLAVCPDTTKGARDRALFAVAFSGALRRSEVVGIDVEHLSWHDKGVKLLIPRSKGDQQGVGQTIAIPTGNFIRPCQMIRNWLDVSGITRGPLFRPVNRGGFIAATRLCDDGFVRTLKSRCAAAGLDPELFSGQSMRSGYVTTAVEHRVDLMRIREQTRHKSMDGLAAYCHRLDLFRSHSGDGFL